MSEEPQPEIKKEEPKSKPITEASELELKAAAYEIICSIENSRNQLAQVQAEIQKRK